MISWRVGKQPKLLLGTCFYMTCSFRFWYEWGFFGGLGLFLLAAVALLVLRIGGFEAAHAAQPCAARVTSGLRVITLLPLFLVGLGLFINW